MQPGLNADGSVGHCPLSEFLQSKAAISPSVVNLGELDFSKGTCYCCFYKLHVSAQLSDGCSCPTDERHLMKTSSRDVSGRLGSFGDKEEQ